MMAGARYASDEAPVMMRPGISLAEMLALAFRCRHAALIALLIPPLLTGALLLVLPQKYRAQADILVKTGREYLAQSDGDATMTAPTSTKQEGINSEIAMLTSRAVVEATIDAIGLDELYPSLTESPPWFGTVKDAAVEKFNKDLIVEPVKLSNVISVSFDARSVVKAQHVLDKLIAIYIDKHTQVFAAGRSDSYADAITRQVGDIQTLEQDRTRIKLEAGIYDISAQRGALISQRVTAEAHLQDVVNTAATLRSRLASLTASRAAMPGTVKSTSTVPDDEVSHTKQSLVELHATEAAMAAHFDSSYPALRDVRAQITTLEHRAGNGARDRVNVTTAPSPLAQQIDTEIVMDRAQLAPLADEHVRYNALVATLGGELARLEQADLALRTIAMRIDAMTDTLRTMQTRYGQARTQEQMDLARQVSVVQVAPAKSPDAPAKPNVLLFAAGSILLGLLASGGVVLFAIITNNTIVTEDGAERLLGLPVLLAMPMAPRRSATVTLAVE